MNRRVIAAVVAAVLALGGLGLIAKYVSDADSRASAGFDTKDVYVVTQPIAKGAAAESVALAVEKKKLPASAIPADAVTDLKQIDNRFADVSLVPSEVLLMSRFVDKATLSQGSVTVPDGMEQLTVKVSPEQIRGGMIQAGDRVGIINSMKLDPGSTIQGPDGKPIKLVDDYVTTTVLNQVLIVRVQGATPTSSTDSKDPTEAQMPIGELFLTVAVMPNDAEKIAWLLNGGKIVFVVQNDKTNIANGTGVTGAEVYKK